MFTAAWSSLGLSGLIWAVAGCPSGPHPGAPVVRTRIHHACHPTVAPTHVQRTRYRPRAAHQLMCNTHTTYPIAAVRRKRIWHGGCAGRSAHGCSSQRRTRRQSELHATRLRPAIPHIAPTYSSNRGVSWKRQVGSVRDEVKPHMERSPRLGCIARARRQVGEPRSLVRADLLGVDLLDLENLVDAVLDDVEERVVGCDTLSRIEGLPARAHILVGENHATHR